MLTCILCKRRILSAFVFVPVVCDRKGRPLYTAPAHAACVDLAAEELTGEDLTAARAALAAGHEARAACGLLATGRPGGDRMNAPDVIRVSGGRGLACGRDRRNPDNPSLVAHGTLTRRGRP